MGPWFYYGPQDYCGAMVLLWGYKIIVGQWFYCGVMSFIEGPSRFCVGSCSFVVSRDVCCAPWILL